MKKKIYIVPCTEVLTCNIGQMVMASTLGEPNDSGTAVTPTEEVYDDEFQSRGQNVWDEGDDGFGW
jgi:hypothetical protein